MGVYLDIRGSRGEVVRLQRARGRGTKVRLPNTHTHTHTQNPPRTILLLINLKVTVPYDERTRGARREAEIFDKRHLCMSGQGQVKSTALRYVALRYVALRYVALRCAEMEIICSFSYLIQYSDYLVVIIGQMVWCEIIWISPQQVPLGGCHGHTVTHTHTRTRTQQQTCQELM